MSKKLYRSRQDKVVSGVCAGIAEYAGLDVSLVRIITFAAVFFGGLSFWIYVLLAVIVPIEPKDPLYKVQIVDEDDDW